MPALSSLIESRDSCAWTTRKAIFISKVVILSTISDILVSLNECFSTRSTWMRNWSSNFSTGSSLYVLSQLKRWTRFLSWDIFYLWLFCRFERSCFIILEENVRIFSNRLERKTTACAMFPRKPVTFLIEMSHAIPTQYWNTRNPWWVQTNLSHRKQLLPTIEKNRLLIKHKKAIAFKSINSLSRSYKLARLLSDVRI